MEKKEKNNIWKRMTVVHNERVQEPPQIFILYTDEITRRQTELAWVNGGDSSRHGETEVEEELKTLIAMSETLETDSSRSPARKRAQAKHRGSKREGRFYIYGQMAGMDEGKIQIRPEPDQNKDGPESLQQNTVPVCTMQERNASMNPAVQQYIGVPARSPE